MRAILQQPQLIPVLLQQLTQLYSRPVRSLSHLHILITPCGELHTSQLRLGLRTAVLCLPRQGDDRLKKRLFVLLESMRDWMMHNLTKQMQKRVQAQVACI